MAKKKIPALGVIQITFAPPRPDDLGTDLLFALAARLPTKERCSWANADGSWTFDLRIKDIHATEDAAKRALAHIAKRSSFAVQAIETFRFFGPIEVGLPSYEAVQTDLSPILPATEAELSATVNIGIEQPFRHNKAATATIKRLVGRAGKVTAQDFGSVAYDIAIDFADARRLEGCFDAILAALRKYKTLTMTSISVYTVSPAVTPSCV